MDIKTYADRIASILQTLPLERVYNSPKQALVLGLLLASQQEPNEEGLKLLDKLMAAPIEAIRDTCLGAMLLANGVPQHWLPTNIRMQSHNGDMLVTFDPPKGVDMSDIGKLPEFVYDPQGQPVDEPKRVHLKELKSAGSASIAGGKEGPFLVPGNKTIN